MSYQAIALPILREVGEDLRASFGRVELLGNKSNSAADVVTKLDRESEERIASAFQKADPSAGFYGEEFGGEKDGERFWLCDPIDGTSHFIRGTPFCTSMLSLVEGGAVVFSAVYDFVRGDMYWAEKGRGAWKNNERISVSERSFPQAYLCMEANTEKPEVLEKFLWFRKNSIVLNTISAGWEFAMTASGKLDGRIMLEPYGHIWDFTPGSLLVEEAGGVVRNIGKDSYDYRNLNALMVNKAVYHELTEGEDTPFPLESA